MEKLKFKVISTDPFYGRMLTLELLNMGFTESAPDANDYRILVAEGMCELPALRRLRGAAFVDCGLLSASMPEQVKVLILGKPFALSELREFLTSLTENDEEREYEENRLIISPEDMTVSFGDVVVRLTPREFALLEYLYSRPGETVSRAQLLKALWKDESARDTNIVDVYVRFLRAKLDEPLGLRLIRAVRGEGYVYAYENARPGYSGKVTSKKSVKRVDTYELFDAEQQKI